MKKSRDFDSSLELLLDTMCNSFGGVMFIAISLIIVLSMMSKVSVASDENFKNIEEMQAKLEELKKELDKTTKEISDISRLLDQLKNDPRRKFLEDIIKLEAAKKKLQTENKLLQTEIQMQKYKNEELIRKREQIQNKLSVKKAEQQKIITENLKLEKDLQQLKDELKKVNNGHITFKTMTPSKSVPYFLIVNDSKIYRVGPERSSGKKLNKEPHSDVAFAQVDNNIICTIKAETAGVPLLDGDTISSAAADLISKLDNDRFPEFSIHSNSLRDFCKFREVLKKRNIRHSVNTYFESFDKQFIYRISPKKENYEAY